MREYFDTSVLVAAFWGGHVHHTQSIKRLAAASKKHSACSMLTVAEVYAVMTALPVKPALPPEQVLLFIEEIRDRLTLVSLTAEEYFNAIKNVSDLGYTGGRVYDALLLACAAKSNPQVIYTWNLNHFRSLAPNLADYIQTP